jgi:uncharacterized protein YdhG (YjbR/CyaY superfamily)
MRIVADSPEAYLAAVPPERRPHLEKLRALIKKSVPRAREGINWGMLGYSIGERPFAAMASQKSYLSLYLMDLYTTPRLREQHAAALAELEMGKSCINFQSVEELPLDTIGAILREAPNVVVTGGTMAPKASKNAPKAAKRAPKPAKKASKAGRKPSQAAKKPRKKR